MLRPIKNLTKSAIRGLVRARLNAFPLSAETAEWYAEKIKQWPAVLGDLRFQTRRKLRAGMTMNVGLVDVIERTLLTTNEWDPIVEKAIRACVQRGDTFLDVGANIGYFSLLASDLVGDTGRVVSFEPSARALSKLTTHLCLNQCSNVTVCSQAMGEVVGPERLNWASSSNIGGSSIARGTASQGYSEQIFVRKLDDVCQEMNLQPSFMKLDVEGFELFALRGAEQTLRTFHPVVVCELTNQFLTDHSQSADEMLNFMTALGYEAWIINLSADGELVAEKCNGTDTPVNQAEVMFCTEAPQFSAEQPKTELQTAATEI